jgi:hypothetical protein
MIVTCLNNGVYDRLKMSSPSLMTSRKSRPIINSRGTLSSHSAMASDLFGGCKDGVSITLVY